MSGIMWGIVDLKRINNDLYVTGDKMMSFMREYKIDKYSSIKNENIYFGNGLQYITAESLGEKLPICNSNILLTCDAIIDNRQELIEEFNENHNVEYYTDSEYILKAYKKWGRNCVNHLEGDFTFAIWDKKKQQLFCARDHVGKRTLYYYYKDGLFIFCTVIKPILSAAGIKTLNERWIADFLAIPGVLNSAHISDTIYENIKQVPPSTYIIVDKNDIGFTKYWNPEKEIKIKHLKNEQEYLDKFRNVFSKAVIQRTRTYKDVGIMLSSGLDSTSVAAYAAQYLDLHHKKLKSFTSIPLKENENLNVSGRSIDETYGVNLMSKKYKNIVCEFCQLEDKSALESLEERCDFLEMPYKAIENISWYTGIASRAYQSDCRVLLDGQYGNLTISYGDCYTTLLTMIRSFNMIGVVREVRSLHNKYSVKYKQILKLIMKMTAPYKFRKKRFDIKNKTFDKYEFSLISKKLLDKYKLDQLLEKENLVVYPEKYYDWNEVRKLIVNPVMLSHIAEYETKVSLKYGILKRDPTRDKNLIELILSFPVEVFCKNAQERILITKSMKGLIPDEILNRKIPRGLQAADWIERIRKTWTCTYSSMCEMMKDNTAQYFFSVNKLNEYINKYPQIPKIYSSIEKYEIRTIISAFIFYKYIKNSLKGGENHEERMERTINM